MCFKGKNSWFCSWETRKCANAISGNWNQHGRSPGKKRSPSQGRNASGIHDWSGNREINHGPGRGWFYVYLHTFCGKHPVSSAHYRSRNQNQQSWNMVCSNHGFQDVLCNFSHHRRLWYMQSSERRMLKTFLPRNFNCLILACHVFVGHEKLWWRYEIVTAEKL